jgi:hypothetical protein
MNWPDINAERDWTRAELEEALEHIKEAVLASHDAGQRIHIKAHYRDFLVGGKNVPQVLITYTNGKPV